MVINGSESMTGQINLEFQQPESSENWFLNGYGNSFGRFELNANHTKNYDKWKGDFTWNWKERKRLPNTSDNPVQFQRAGIHQTFHYSMPRLDADFAGEAFIWVEKIF